MISGIIIPRDAFGQSVYWKEAWYFTESTDINNVVLH